MNKRLERKIAKLLKGKAFPDIDEILIEVEVDDELERKYLKEIIRSKL